MNVLVINAGSSSLKYQLIDMSCERTLAKGLAERFGSERSRLCQKSEKGTVEVFAPIRDHAAAIELAIKTLMDPVEGVINSLDEIDAVGHRCAQNALTDSCPAIVDDVVKADIENNNRLAPIHNPVFLMGILACERILPGKPQAVSYDAHFHNTIPKKAYMYGIPQRYEKEFHVRKYGFHGHSNRYISQRVYSWLKLPENNSRIIVCHLGNGSSVTAILNGKSIDNTMGLTPLDGLPMGTRSGSCDPAVVQYIANQKGISIDEVLKILNKESGLLGLSGVSSDLRDLDDAIACGNADAAIARDILVYAVQKQIGAAMAAMNGADVIVFTAGIGESNPSLRKDIMSAFGFVGVMMDNKQNARSSYNDTKEVVISSLESKICVAVIPTNEELIIARDVVSLLQPAINH